MNKESFITLENEPEHLKETNEMQMALARRVYGEKVHERFVEWKEKYSERFRMVLEREIRANPHLLRDWSDPAMRDDILEEIESLLYGEPEVETVAAKEEEKFDKAA